MAMVQFRHRVCHRSAWFPDDGIVQSWTERESFLRSGEYNALAGSQIKLVCFSLKEVEVFGFQSVTPTPHHLLSTAFVTMEAL